MKIACLIHSLDGGGAERVMAGLATRLSQRDHDVTLISLDDGKNDRHTVCESVKRVPLNVMWDGKSRGLPVLSKFRRLLDVRSRVRTIRQAITDVDPNVVLSFCDRTNVLAGLAVRKLKPSQSLQPIPLVVCERSDPAMQTLPIQWQVLRRVGYRNATQIVTQTEVAADYFRSGGPCDFGIPTSVIASAVDEPPLVRDVKLAGEQKLILGIGRLSHEKGFDRLIRSFGEIANKFPDWRLRILGDGPCRDALESQIDSLGLAERVEMPGWIKPVWDELSGATMFLLPSRYEGFPSALLEAMAMGVPSIALANQAGSAQIVQDGFNGRLIDDPNRLAAAMTAWIENPAEREAIGERAKEVATRFNWEAMTLAYEELLGRCVSAPSGTKIGSQP